MNTGKIGLSKIAQIAVQASDLARAKAFYGDALGLPLMFEVSGMAFFDAGGTRFMVGPMFKDTPPSGDVCIYFDPGPDWNATVAALESRGVKFAPRTEIIQRAEGREHALRLFRDPDGNQLALIGWRPAG